MLSLDENTQVSASQQSPPPSQVSFSSEAPGDTPPRRRGIEPGGPAGAVLRLLALLVIAGALIGTTSCQPEGNGSRGGSLNQNLPQQVGDFELQSAKKHDESGLATDSLEASYVSPDGAKVLLIASAYSSPGVANRVAQAFSKSLSKYGYAKQEVFAVHKGPSGQKVGNGMLHVRKNEQLIIWTNGDLYCNIRAPRGHGIQFYKRFPY